MPPPERSGAGTGTRVRRRLCSTLQSLMGLSSHLNHAEPCRMDEVGPIIPSRTNVVQNAARSNLRPRRTGPALVVANAVTGIQAAT